MASFVVPYRALQATLRGASCTAPPFLLPETLCDAVHAARAFSLLERLCGPEPRSRDEALDSLLTSGFLDGGEDAPAHPAAFILSAGAVPSLLTLCRDGDGGEDTT